LQATFHTGAKVSIPGSGSEHKVSYTAPLDAILHREAAAPYAANLWLPVFRAITWFSKANKLQDSGA
jgi:hypothetical protein